MARRYPCPHTLLLGLHSFMYSWRPSLLGNQPWGGGGPHCVGSLVP